MVMQLLSWHIQYTYWNNDPLCPIVEALALAGLPTLSLWGSQACFDLFRRRARQSCSLHTLNPRVRKSCLENSEP